ncbi:MAG: glycine dehydrogenase (aminomethyl-transferring) [Planctomycetota bacterium]|nr:MAG: glycine dehydrogenase (aminomethyl-transferring) [Planctomycetota bacterium]
MTVTTTPPSPSALATQPAARPPVGPLDDRARFDTRHIGPRDHDIAAMLAAVGAASMDDLIAQVVPQDIRFDRLLDLPAARDEWTLLRDLSEIADKNKVFRSCIGMGYHGTITPPVILRNVMENPGWYTQYTPYQAELAQGRLEALLNFQTMIADLTGLPLANASLLDEGTAAAEAMSLCVQQSGGKRRAFIVADDCHPQTIEVVQTRGRSMGVEVRVASPDAFELSEEVAGVLVSYPTTDGRVECFKDLAKRTHDAGALFVAVADPLALVLLTPPGEWGADVCVGSAQRFGVPMGFGGPHAAFMATREEFVRKLPGRLVGVSRDSQGKPALRLAIQTREQHIKRDRATSNICTAQVLLAIMASMYGVYHGPEGLTRIAKRVRAYTQTLRVALTDLGHTIGEGLVFDTLRVKVKGNAEDVIGAAKARRINIRDFGDGTVGVTLDETTDRNLLADLIAAFGGTGKEDLDALAARAKMDIPSAFARTSKFMTHPVFNTHRSETEMLRYLQQLQSRDLSLTHSMIPLGSCTMKLNATSEMMPVTWPQFAHLHPFAPREQWEGYAEIFRQLESWLSEITGFAAVSLQPNAGSQGEYAGLLTIKAYHEHHGNAHRDVCLIPESAHGTNPASAVIAGMKVVPVKVNEQGAIVFSDLKAKAEQHAETLAAAMITYPSTCGVFDDNIRDMCAVVHEHGGLVYLDGANMNAQVGLCRPGDFGADVCHLNLHKTFCIPHGGGGPGMGPIGVNEKLRPFLPGHSVLRPASAGEHAVGAVSAAPYGSPSILLISWAYIAMMGPRGLKKATEVAILNANYMAERLKDHYQILFRGSKGRVAHEFVLDCRPFKKSAGIEIDDIAKRLIDFGFHAPTMSWPVPGTLMVEPTESESKAELDRFCDAMIAIRQEIAKVENGDWSGEDNPLKGAPHCLGEVTSSDWKHAYLRDEAAYPAEHLRAFKFWAPVGRVDNPYGDRNLMCTCPSVGDACEA